MFPVKESIKFYFSPFFIARYYFLKDLRSLLTQYKFKGNLMDIGCGSKPYKKFFLHVKKYQGIDFKNYSINRDFEEDTPDYYFSTTYKHSLLIPFRKNQFDNSVSFQVLEHHPSPQRMIHEMVRITKPGGYILISVPFIWPLHEIPYDYHRFTEYYFHNIFSDLHCTILQIKKEGSLFSTLILLVSDYLDIVASRSKLYYYPIALVFLPVLFFHYASIFIDRIFPSKEIFFNYLVLARKKPARLGI